MSRGIVLSDTHCGHRAGLTPPEMEKRPEPSNELEYYFYEMRRELWRLFEEQVDALRPFDWLLYNGDAIEGLGYFNSGVENLYTDRQMQTEIAAAVVAFVGAERNHMIRGTRVHVGKEEDWEDVLARKIHADSHNEADFELNGCIVNAKHKVSRSSIPHGRLTPISRARMWNHLKAAKGKNPRANILIRSHVHYFTYCGESDWIAMSTPALQADTDYGTREVEGDTDLGFVHFDIEDGGQFTWQAHTFEITTTVRHAVPL